MSISARLVQALQSQSPPMSKRRFQRVMHEQAAHGSSIPAVFRYLKGANIPSVEFLQAAARTLAVREAWLICGDGPPRPDSVTDTMDMLEYNSALFPVTEYRAWHEQVDVLSLPDAASTALRRLPAVLRVIEQLDLGQVQTPAGKAAYRYAPEYREAARLEYRAWITLLRAWIDDEGAAAVKKKLSKLTDPRSRASGGKSKRPTRRRKN